MLLMEKLVTAGWIVPLLTSGILPDGNIWLDKLNTGRWVHLGHMHLVCVVIGLILFGTHLPIVILMGSLIVTAQMATDIIVTVLWLRGWL